MLIIVSDMHLTDQTLAPSVPIETLERFLEEVKKIAAGRKSVEMILLGDIFDVLRSSRWLVNISRESSNNRIHIPVNVRPWHAVDHPLERIVSVILDDIRKTCGFFFEELKQIGNMTTTWVPGNHDRLVKITEAGGQFLREMGITASDDYRILRKEYGIFARHGHYFDEYNIRDRNYKLSPFGDAIVVELLNKLQVKTAEKRKIVNFNHGEISFLGAVEYLRPHARVPVWIHKRTAVLDDVLLRNRVREAWCSAVDDFNSSEMLELLPDGKRNIFSMLLSQSKDFRSPLNKLVELFEKLFDKPERYKECAEREDVLNDPDIRYVIYGHTHFPGEIRLSNGKYYINTGWWERSYEPPELEEKPYMKNFNYLICGNKPELKQIPVNSPIENGIRPTAYPYLPQIRLNTPLTSRNSLEKKRP